MAATLRDFCYPTRWQQDDYGNNRYDVEPRETLVLTPVFQIRHVPTGLVLDAVLSRWRSDRRYAWIVLARFPPTSRIDTQIGKILDDLHDGEWCGCGGGYTEIIVTRVDAGRDYPFETRYWRAKTGRHEMFEHPTDLWNIWLAAMTGLRANDFTTAACPFGRHSRFVD